MRLRCIRRMDCARPLPTIAAAFCIALTLPPQLAVADFDREEAAESYVGVHVYSGREQVRTATGIVLGPESVLTNARVTARGQRHAVVIASGAEITATIEHANDHSGMAVLNVPGLEAPPVTLAQREVAPDEDRFVFAVSFATATGTSGAAFTFPMGSVARAEEFTPPRGATAFPLYEHNALFTAAGFGGALLNNCGELIGVNRPNPDARGWFSDVLRDPQGVAFATRLGRVQEQLDAWGVDYRKADSDCQTPAESAALRATEMEREAQDAEQALNEAQARERELADAAMAAQESVAAAEKAGDEHRTQAEAARKEAEEAQSEVEQAAQAVEAAQKRLQEAEEAADAAREVAEAEAAQLREELQQANEAKARSEAESSRNLLTAIIGGAGLLLLAILLFVLRSRQKNRQLAEEREKAEQAQSELETATRKSEFPDCLFEGTDQQGRKFALKIPGTSLGATVDGVTIGRNPERATFVIDSPSVSRMHCRLKFDGDALTISDLNSSNGVLINDVKLVGEESKLLRSGDRVTLGDVELTLRAL